MSQDWLWQSRSRSCGLFSVRSFRWRPGWSVLSRVFSPRVFDGPRDVFATSLSDATRTVLGFTGNSLKSTQGHMVVRVEPGGETFQVIVLEDSDESYSIREMFGPYPSR
jgi:hypothetical protein